MGNMSRVEFERNWLFRVAQLAEEKDDFQTGSCGVTITMNSLALLEQ